ncbi:uncharacterized protein B0H18DRAFT_987538 [Fomitopsis serialis]|uniref:uncharacterized protein n=1 Tax=Fomitopsis serialis TaxID=139415 RepID=UPI00200767A4|nr:uncharacterized protein B0H18DRAFT_987538 [Neoantrodia serialis]KAH9932313.1 hypothetical protein B0H18DRAFT_987538 [Neoantrodia serialis]
MFRHTYLGQDQVRSSGRGTLPTAAYSRVSGQQPIAVAHRPRPYHQKRTSRPTTKRP